MAEATIDQSRPRVLHVVISLDVGGLERIVLDLLREGQSLGQDASVLCLERPGALAARAEELGATVWCVEKPPGTLPMFWRKIVPMIREIAPDVIHTHQITPLFYVGPAAKKCGVPAIVHTEHGKNYASRMRTRLVGRLAARHVAKFFCVSNDIAREVTACGIAPREKVSIVANGIDSCRFARRDQRDALRRSLAIPNDATVIGTVGRLSDVKRQDLLIRAFALARRTDPRMRLVLVGDGPRGADLRALVAQLNLSSSVDFVGYQPKPERYMQIMDVFALPSRSEGMPLAVLEAWAAGLAVVGSRVGGIPELIEHQYTGLLFESGDERALASALATLTRDRAMATRLGEAGQNTVRTKFQIRATAQKYHAHYRELLPSARLLESSAV